MPIAPRILFLAAATLLAGCASSPHSHSHHDHPHDAHRGTITADVAALSQGDAAMEKASREMADAANAFWNSLTPELKAKSAFPFDTEERFNWHFVPRERKGITWNEMSEPQKKAARAFLASGLSTRGYQQVEAIVSLEIILKELENGAARRDPGNYAFSVFGTPGEKGPWGWRFEGHHLSINITIVNGRAAAGPVFFGTNPAQVMQGPKAGLRILDVEDDLGRELVKSLTEEQRKTAIYRNTSPGDIVTSNNRKADPGAPIGLPVSSMTPAQKKLLMTLVENYAYRLRPELADDDLKKIEAAGFEKIHFAWAGGLEPGQGHYYRLHGPSFLVEFDNSQNNANHIHTVWRDAANDFGEDLLRLHYQRAATDHGHDH